MQHEYDHESRHIPDTEIMVVNPDWLDAPYLDHVFGPGITDSESKLISPRYASYSDMQLKRPIPRMITLAEAKKMPNFKQDETTP